MKLKQMLLPVATLITVVFVIQACRKFDFFSKPKDEFKMEDAKEWYYGSFNKTAIFKQLDRSSVFAPDELSVDVKKYPYWSKAVRYSLGSLEVVEMPVVRTYTQLALPGSGNLSEKERLQIASGAIEKLLFIKKSDGTIAVRLLTFIPDIGYLKKSNFDISHNNMGNPDKDFSGYIIVKEWSEKVVSFRKVANGKYTRNVRLAKHDESLKEGKTVNVNTESKTLSDECGWQYTPIYQQFLLDVSLQGDDPNAAQGSGEIYMGDMVEYIGCGEPDSNPYDGCMNLMDNSDVCNCELYGVGCGGGGDTPDDDGQCQMTTMEASAALSSVTTTAVTDGVYNLGTESTPDANGIIKKPIIVHTDGIENSYILGFKDRYELFFTGAIFKTTSNSTWKWNTLSYDKIQKVSGSTPPCISNTTVATVASPVISNDLLSAGIAASVSTTLSISCVGGSVIETRTTNISSTYVANTYQ